MASLRTVFGTSRSRFFLLMCATAAPVCAQTPAPASSREIIVTGLPRILGVEPERVISAEDVATYGLSNIGELVDELADERGRARDDVIYFINGKRVAGLGDIAAFPTEAVQSIELLPTGSALKIGGSVNQQVVNISLKDKVRTLVGRVLVGVATDGDFGSHNGDISVTDIAQTRRIAVALRLRREDALLEADRNILQADDARPDLGRFRTLRPEIGDIELRASVTDQLAPNLNGFVTARVFEGSTRSFLGVDANTDRIDQRSQLRSANVDIQLNGDIGGWLLAFNGTYAVNRRRTQTGTGFGSGNSANGITRTFALTRNASLEMFATRPLIDLPAGPLMLTLRGRLSRNSIDAGSESFVQNTREVGAGIQVPLTSAGEGPFGGVIAGADWSHNRTSRSGSFTGATYSLQWEPSTWLRLTGSVSTSRTPPGVDLLSAPILATPGVRYLDPLGGAATDVIELSGGNPALDNQRGNNRRLSLELRPLRSTPLTLTADYMKVSNRDTITVLPPGNSLLLFAFPERFLRDAGGRLIQVDIRPVNFARQSEEQLRYGFDWNVPLVAATGTTPSRASSRARLQFNLSHTVLFKSEILVAPGFGAVDLLSRDAVGFSGAERPRHEFDFAVGYAERGLGLRLAGQHKTTSFLSLTSGESPTTLRFSPLTTLNVRAFVEGQRLIPSAEWLKGARLSLLVNNLVNSRQMVRDSAGRIPLPYHPSYRDPIGRLVQLEFRKSF